VGTDDYYNNIYAYKINRTDCYFEVAETCKDEVRAKMGKQYKRYFVKNLTRL